VTLLAIMIVWSLYNFTQLHHRYEQVRWFESLMHKINPTVQKFVSQENWRFSLLIFIPLFIFWIAVHVLKYSTGPLGRLLIDTVVLWYCWLYQEPLSIIPGSIRDKTRVLFYDALSQKFSVTFWFIVLGPMGALSYDFTRRAQTSSYGPYARQMRQLLDWAPARLLSIGYALAGHFNPSFSYWVLHLFTGIEQNRLFLENSGLAALNGDMTERPLDDKEPEHAVALVKRAEIMLLIVFIIFTLGSLIY
jgi:membrane protein required for beta-lactamase induction